MNAHFAVRGRGFSRLVANRSLLVLGALVAAVVTVAALGTTLGSTWIPVDRVGAALFGSGTPVENLIVRQLRLPRVVEALIAGAALGAAGLLLQRATRNPLASPAVLGVVDGAALGVMLFLVVFNNGNNTLALSMAWQPVAAGAGAVIFAAVLLVCAHDQWHTPVRLLLFGIAVAALAQAATLLLMISGPIHLASQALRWLAGSVHAASWLEVGLIGAALAPLFLLAGFFARFLPLLELDAETAGSVGLRVAVMRLCAVLLAAALTASTVAFVGGMRFVGLLAPHLAGRLIGAGAGATLAGSALAGAVIVAVADVAVRALFAPLDVPAGTVTAVIGAPYFIYLLIYRSRLDG